MVVLVIRWIADEFSPTHVAATFEDSKKSRAREKEKGKNSRHLESN
jgi:hypothetical protein